MYPRTTSLFHFTAELPNLKSIIQSKHFLPSYSLEDQSWLLGSGIFVAYPIVCFCDIPLARLKSHTDFYGKYGLGMSQSWAISNGINPVTYISHSSLYKRLLSALISSQAETVDVAMDVVGFTKPFRGKMLRRGEWIRRDFYPECEWRFLATRNRSRAKKERNYLSREEYESEEMRDSLIQEIRKDSELGFELGDIKYILVAEDSEIPELVDMMMVYLKDEKQGDVQLLMTRILSLENIGEVV